MPTLDLQAQSPSLDDMAFEDDALPPTNRDADHHTIVDMNLRTVRFSICVTVALVVAFSYAFVTNNPSVVAHASTQAQVDAKVNFFNVLLGTTMFTASKIFEIYTDTLIFPTLHTYLHNCSLYPGDEPQRTTSKIKTNAIFWGLKTVIILMNVGTTSLFVSQRTRPGTTTTTTAVALAVQTHARQLQSLPDMNSDVDAFFFARTLDEWKYDKVSSCNTPSKWTRADVDYTSVSLGVNTRRPWSEEIARGSSSSDDAVVVQLADCAVGNTVSCEEAFQTHGVDASSVAQLLARGFLTSSSGNSTSMQDTSKDLLAFLQSTTPDAVAGKATLSVERVHHAANGVASLTATVNVPRIVPADSLVCGSHHCVIATTVDPPQEISLQQLSGQKFLARATTRHAVSQAGGSLHEILSFSIATHQLPTQSSSVFHWPVDDDGSHVVLQNLSSLASSPTRLVTLNAVVLPEASGLKTWLPVTTSSSAVVSSYCDPLVDAYVAQFQRDAAALSPSHLATTMATATMLFLTQDASYQPSKQATLAIERRLASTTTKDDKTVKLTLSISIYSASATFAGCGTMVILMLFVILRPAARVRLSPNTTPAAQYVQILTDDLYPNIVHKKRLRFANGEALPFNEYVVDSIVLHAKRDSSKKIYL